ncbi:MAG TPA: hypothetical protein VHS27_03995 [Gaiellales bacterium]|nr:hypothetical protein [Gaiellales bacterium]
MTRSSPDWDLLMRTATSEAASTIVPTAKAGHAVEKDLEDALAASLVVPNHRVVLRKKIPHTYPGWTPQPGPLDLGIYAGDHVVVPCELKLHDIDWGLYDLLKVVSLFRADKAATAAYLITGGTKKEWTKSGLGRYFAPGVRTVGTLDLLRRTRRRGWETSCTSTKKGSSSPRAGHRPSPRRLCSKASSRTDATSVGSARSR